LQKLSKNLLFPLLSFKYLLLNTRFAVVFVFAVLAFQVALFAVFSVV